MTKIKLGLIFLMAFSSSWALAEQKFGGGADMARLLELETVMQSPATYTDKTITVTGVIKEVCHKKGCWMELSAGDDFDNLIVKVRDGDMVFPISARGKVAFATGVLTASQLDVERTRAYLAHRAEENNLEFDPASVIEGMTLYRLKPTGVTIAGK
ncbi:DUF4920 domain-containing protein [Pseudoteredinibacter isoporae]|uniref:DUF4920 domain-containing protein n=1 Tax=Pseudoteredinibacter isoporae TaxID=570281 RepID=A0A7X0JWP3_9GAMM|nr:DUF4920 domain-containing protein [Pseudoteredinibacter isoporae]MBB6523582.1 hypothetical protein [Pseudoteredinibacter isoporae]NHO89090.1 DUF4920 domain-containing protein [Pseudoteredinibacter isoporae]NIB22299.1 DUF4920 domain-containing protein [Pseudoteredinibacter isoporae]